ncbi:hypothetical protein ES703_90793 [subsurface metagenome]
MGNSITEIKALDKLITLTELRFGDGPEESGNEITEIKGLENLKNLHTLDLSCNCISEIKGVEN